MIYDVAIIGAGVSGLTTAYDLHRRGYRVIVLERQQQIGGNAISEPINGFLMEHGPTTLNAMVPQAHELAGELGLADQQVDLGRAIAKRYLRQGDYLHGISINPAGFLLSNYLSPMGRASLMFEAFRTCKSNDEDETVYAFATRRFGAEFAEKVMDPLVAGMFAGDAKKLSMNSAFPTLRELERAHGSITRGILKARRGSEPAKRLFSFRHGVGTLPQSLGAALGDTVRTGVAVRSVVHGGKGYRVTTHKHGNISARSVVLAVQPHVATQLLEPLDPEGASITSQFDAPPMGVVFLGFKREQVAHPLDSLGFLSCKNSDGIITGAQFLSTMFEGRAPDDHVAIAAYVGGVRNREAALMKTDDLVGQVQAELSSLLEIKGTPVLTRARQWVRSLPQYELGHGDKVKAMNALSDRHPGVYLTGNYISGVSIANCIGQARKTANNVKDYLVSSKADDSNKINMYSGFKTQNVSAQSSS